METLICDIENIGENKKLIKDIIKKYKISHIFMSSELSKLFNDLNMFSIKYDLNKNIGFDGKYSYVLVSDSGEYLCGIIISKNIPENLCIFTDYTGFSVINLKIKVK